MNKEIKEYALMLINNKAKNNRLSIRKKNEKELENVWDFINTREIRL